MKASLEHQTGGPGECGAADDMLTRLLAFGCIWFATWTLCCHALVQASATIVPLAWMGLLFVLAAAVWGARLVRSVPGFTSRRGFTLAALSLACVVAYLGWVRPDADDALYISFAVAALDDPTAPLLHGDTLQGIDGLPILLPVYRLHAWELLAAAFSRLTNSEPIVWLHLVFGTVAASSLSLAWAAMFRRLAPDRWLACTLVVVLLFLFVGGPHRWYANFGPIRFQQGKAIFVSVLIPIVIALAYDFARHPGRRTGMRLAAAQVASLGMSSTAIWVAPMVGGLTVLAVAGLSRASVRTLALGALACAYPVVAGLFVRAETQRGLRTIERPEIFELQVPGATAESLDRVGEVVTSVLGTPALMGLAVGSLAVAWRLVAPGPARRVAMIFPAFAVGVLLNPWVADLLARIVTGDLTYWRVSWVIPLLGFVAIALTGPLGIDRLGRNTRVTLTAALVAVTLLGVPDRRVLDASNGARFDPFGLAVPAWFDLVRDLAQAVGPEKVVLLPVHAAPWIRTLRDAPFPVVARPIYLILRTDALGDEVERRIELATLAGRPRARARRSDAFAAALDERAVSGLWLAGKVPGEQEKLRALGFRPFARWGNQFLWTRVSAPATPSGAVGRPAADAHPPGDS